MQGCQEQSIMPLLSILVKLWHVLGKGANYHDGQQPAKIKILFGELRTVKLSAIETREHFACRSEHSLT